MFLPLYPIDFAMIRIPSEVPVKLQNDIKSIREEVANMISHGAGLVLAALAVPFLLYAAHKTGKEWHFWGTVIYSISLFMVYTSSTLYHSVYRVKLRRILRTLDHISIYFLIAGSYTPFIVAHLRTSLGWTVFIILWSMAAIGTIFKLFYTHRFKKLSTLAYLVMGWMAIVLIKPLMTLLPPESFKWIVIGGMSYTLGTIFYLWKGLKYNHFIWHLWVLGGSIGHFVAVYYAITA